MSKEASFSSCWSECESADKKCMALSYDHENSYCHFFNKDDLKSASNSQFTSLKRKCKRNCSLK